LSSVFCLLFFLFNLQSSAFGLQPKFSVSVGVYLWQECFPPRKGIGLFAIQASGPEAGKATIRQQAHDKRISCSSLAQTEKNIVPISRFWL
jgi:hypothetical protein